MSGGCCCHGTRADTSGRTSILGLFPCWAATASRSCSGLGGRGHSADDGFILRRVAWLSQAKTRPEARPARTYSGAAQTGGWTFHRIAPAWGAAATCDMMAGGRQRLQTTAAADDGGRRRRQTTAEDSGGDHRPQPHLPPPRPPPSSLLTASPNSQHHTLKVSAMGTFLGETREETLIICGGSGGGQRRWRTAGGGIYEIESTTVIICC